MTSLCENPKILIIGLWGIL